MPIPVLDGMVIEVTLVGRHQAQTVLTVLHYKATVPPAVFQDFAPLEDQVLDHLLITGGVVKSYLDAMSEEYEQSTIRIQPISPVRYAFFDHPQTASAGTVAAPAFPPNVSCVIVKRNELTGRHNRGSVHMPAVPLTFIDGGVITTGARVAYAALGDALTIPFTISGGGGDTDWNPVIFRKANPPLSEVFTACSPQETSRIMRRRTLGVGI